MCTEVCERGSVVVEPWLAHAIKQQTKLVQSLPLCYATLLGTHNSAISLADGYGNLDEYFRGGAAAARRVCLCVCRCAACCRAQELSLQLASSLDKSTC